MPEPDGPQFSDPPPALPRSEDFPSKYPKDGSYPVPELTFLRSKHARPWGKSPYLDALEIALHAEFGPYTQENVDYLETEEGRAELDRLHRERWL